jgi:hypothetical protein
MRYLCVYKSEEGQPPTEKTMADMGSLIDEMFQKGVLLATEGCMPTAHGVRVRKTGKRVTVIDGPFAEAKEVIGGFALIKVDSKDEAIAWTKRFLDIAGDGESEVRLLCDPPPQA